MIALLAFGFFILALGQLRAPGAGRRLVVGLTHAGCIGSYLALLREAAKRALAEPRRHRRQRRSLFGEVISVLFLFFLLHLVLDMGLQLPLVSLLAGGATSLVCNPVLGSRARGLQSMGCREGARRGWSARADLAAAPGAAADPSQPPAEPADLHPALLDELRSPLQLRRPHLYSAGSTVRGLPERAPQAGELSRLAGVTLSVHGLMVFRACLFHEIEHYNPRLEAWRSKMSCACPSSRPAGDGRRHRWARVVDPGSRRRCPDEPGRNRSGRVLGVQLLQQLRDLFSHGYLG